MNNRADRWSELMAGYCLASAVVLTSVLQLARGQEELPPPAPQLPGAKANQVLIDHRPRILILTNVPPSVLANASALGQLFEKAGGPTGCEEMLQRIGIGPEHEVADHPVAASDPGMSLVVERVTEALRAELGNNVMFRVTARPFSGRFPGALLQENCDGLPCCDEMLSRMDAGRSSDSWPQTMEFNVHVISPLPATQNPPLPRVGFAPGALIDTREVRNSARRLKANLLSRVESQNGDSFVRLGCAACGLGECKCGSDAKCASETVCGSECAAAHCTAATCTAGTCTAETLTAAKASECKCDDCKCCKHALAHDVTKCGEEEANCGEECGATLTMVVENAEHHDEFADYHPLKLMRQIAELMAEKAAAEVALEVRSEAQEELAEVYEAMAEVMADNAALDAKLIAAAEHRKLLERITDLATENARLKTQNELAAERIEMAKSSVALSLENEHLKTRLAELEQKHAAAEAARTAAKSSGDRESR